MQESTIPCAIMLSGVSPFLSGDNKAASLHSNMQESSTCKSQVARVNKCQQLASVSDFISGGFVMSVEHEGVTLETFTTLDS